jgi:hypothetical protein
VRHVLDSRFFPYGIGLFVALLHYVSPVASFVVAVTVSLWAVISTWRLWRIRSRKHRPPAPKEGEQ